MNRIIARLEKLGVQGILLKAAQQGQIKELRCALEPCLCPEELGGATHFDPVPEELPDWMPTADHIELKSQGGKLTVQNVQLMHRLCNRARYPIEKHGKPHQKDLDRVEAARRRALAHKSTDMSRDVRFAGRRKKIVGHIEELWEQYPDLRFGQLVAVVLTHDTAGLFDMEDEDLELKLATQVKRIRKTAGKND